MATKRDWGDDVTLLMCDGGPEAWKTLSNRGDKGGRGGEKKKKGKRCGWGSRSPSHKDGKEQWGEVVWKAGTGRSLGKWVPSIDLEN